MAVKTDETKTAVTPATTPAEPSFSVHAPTRARSADSDDPSVGWTVQSDAPLPVVPDAPGQVLKREELPDEEAQRKAGIDPGAWAGCGKVYVEG